MLDYVHNGSYRSKVNIINCVQALEFDYSVIISVRGHLSRQVYGREIVFEGNSKIKITELDHLVDFGWTNLT